MRWLLILSVVVLATSETRYDGVKVLRINPRDSHELKMVQSLESLDTVEFWNSVRTPGRPVDLMVSPEDDAVITSFLTSRGLDFTVMMPDVQAVIDDQMTAIRARPSGVGSADLADFDYDIYHPYEEIVQWIDDMASEHSSIVSKFFVTQSYEGRNINGIRISSGSASPKKLAIWFEGGIHAREWISPATVMIISKSLVEDYEANLPRVVNILDQVDFYIVPSLNVDGYAYTFSDDRLWRKTRSPNPDMGCVGTDPNRNWPYGWGGSGASPWACTQTYRGSGPLSEVEIAGVVNFLNNLKSSGTEVRMFIDWHSYSQYWMAPWSDSASAPNPPDWLDQQNLGNAAVQAIESVFGTDYLAGMSAKMLYEAAGASLDWAYADLGAKYSYVVELRDTGQYGFLLPEDQISETGEESYQGALTGVEYAMNN